MCAQYKYKMPLNDNKSAYGFVVGQINYRWKKSYETIIFKLSDHKSTKYVVNIRKCNIVKTAHRTL